MNTRFFFVLLALPALVLGESSSPLASPEIASWRWRTVRVEVPEGFESVTLQRRSSRPGQPWKTVGVKRAVNGKAEFRLKKPLPRRMLRVLGTRAGELPPGFFSGPSDFFPAEDSRPMVTLGGPVPRGGAAGGLSVAANSAGAAEDVAAPVREVVESDVWRLSGDTLYLFNQYRGLQVLDVKEPAAPALLGTLPLPAAGEDLYDLGRGFVALLSRSPFAMGWNVNAPAGEEGAVVVCDASAGAPVVAAVLPVAGELLASRLVGSALYVAARVPEAGADSWSGRQCVQVTGFDLSDPANPVVRNTVTLKAPKNDAYAYFGAVQASSRLFMVAENTWRWDLGEERSAVSLVDISDPNGTVRLRGRVAVGGHVRDKFKLYEKDGTLSVISFYQGWREGRRRSLTRLDNFDVSDADKPRALGRVELGLGEQVHGTRFDGERVYVVTFFQIDPLWIVDNSDPAAPEIASELEVPGFSTYLAPMGDRLLTVGFVDNRVALSLFDVGDAENPTLLTQLPVTEPGAWSEANWDEKALAVLPEAGLVMLPVSAGWSRWWDDAGDVESSGVQLVDLGRDGLTLRGRIPHGFAPRRAAVHAGSVIAFSQEALLTADITDRDAPVVTNELQLAWRTDRVWHVGGHLLQIGGRIDGADTVVSVSPAGTPDETVSSLNLGPDVLVAADVREGYLFTIQQEVVPPGVQTLVAPSVTLRVFDLTSLPRIIPAGMLRTDRVNVTATWSARILWPQDGTLVLVHGHSGGWWGGPVILDAPAVVSPGVAGAALVADARFAPWYPTGSEKHFEQFDVSAVEAPAYVGRETVRSKGWGGFSEAFAAKGRVFVTQGVTGGIIRPLPVLLAGDVAVAAKEDALIAPEEDAHAGRYALYVLDYSDPDAVTRTGPVSAPGVLVGLRGDGRVLYTRGCNYNAQGRGIAGEQVIHASAFDGEKLHLVATAPASGEALAVADKVFTLGWKKAPGAKGEYADVASLWRLDDDGKFRLLDEERFEGSGARAFGDVLFGGSYSGYGGGLAALDFSNPGELKNIGVYRLPGWLWPDLANADGSPADGLWLPFGPYGVLKVELPE